MAPNPPRTAAVERPALPRPARPAATFRFDSLVLTDAESLARGRSATLTISLVLHTLLVALAVLVPLFMTDTLPATDLAIKAFFVAPAEVPAPPPPPPPPPAGAQVVKRAPAEPRPVVEAKFVAPIEVPSEIREEVGSLDLGVEGGVAGGVEGGVPGGVVGGVIGGLPAAPAPVKVVRVGGKIVAPKLLKRVPPIYPPLAVVAHTQGMVILEAQVDTHGAVKSVKVLRSQLLFDEAAVEAVKQWRYEPLLLNGEPTEFILTVTIMFNLTSPGGTTPNP
jgi:protein TonB